MGAILDIDPRILHVPSGRMTGADPFKLSQQIAKFGKALQGMPPIWVTQGKDGEYIINNGVTRAFRAATLAPGQLVPIEVIDTRPNWNLSRFPTVGGLVP